MRPVVNALSSLWLSVVLLIFLALLTWLGDRKSVV